MNGYATCSTPQLILWYKGREEGGDEAQVDVDVDEDCVDVDGSTKVLFPV